MIVDSKGNLFENRRKEGNDRRKTPSGERIRKSKSNKK